MTTRRSSRKPPHPIDALSFTARRDGKVLPKYDLSKGENGRCFWNVVSTDDFLYDCAVGKQYGLEYLAYETKNSDGPPILASIVNDMPRPLTGVEIGFLEVVCFAAGEGAYRVRGFGAHWTTHPELAAA